MARVLVLIVIMVNCGSTATRASAFVRQEPAASQQPASPAAPDPQQPSPAPPPAVPTASVPSPAPSEGTSLDAEQVRGLLHNIYVAAFRFTDLLSILATDKWKMDDAARQPFQQTLDTARKQLAALEDARLQFLEKTDNSDLAEKTDGAISDLLPTIDAVAEAVSQYESATQGSQYKQPGDQLRQLQTTLKPYVEYLHARVQAVLGPMAGVQTEVIRAGTARPPVATLAGAAPPPLQPDEIRQLLHKMYVSCFRIRDLLGQEQPAKWTAPDSDRQGFEETQKELLAKLDAFEKARHSLDSSPQNAGLAFQVYRA
ncbi:MAG TPA: hypothetical protein VN648_07495, partial [Candidatus Methylomirabilis sp.]|nr:hypothetical protein [Candidatus Methylomirabilis sp.]